MPTEPSAKVILDSTNARGDRLTTMEVVMHRFVLAEFNTHRVFSRNSASSRAIPVQKRLDSVRNDPALPLSWPAERPGMQGGDEITGTRLEELVQFWKTQAWNAANAAERAADHGLHKSVVNRILEPFLWHTVVVSSTEWDNFFIQRCSPLAQPEIRVCAEAMLLALTDSKPTELDYGMWHMPYLHEDELHQFANAELAKKISVARCARVSYLTQDGIRDPAKDVELYERLVTATPPHASPLEHVATPALNWHAQNERHISRGNFQGWRQLRHEVLGV